MFINNRFLRERGMLSNPKMEYQFFLCISFKPKVAIAEFFLENAKKNLVFHFGVGRHASFPQKPVVNGGTL